MKDHLAPLDLPVDLDALVALAVKIDKRLWERERKREGSVEQFLCWPAEGAIVIEGFPTHSTYFIRAS